MTRHVEGPYFEDLSIGDALRAPALTVTSGHAAAHQAILGDRIAVQLDARLGRAVFAGAVPAPPGLVVDLAIGQSSVFTRRVTANLFYRGLQLRALPALGDTLRTETEVVALRQNRPRAGRAATGLAVLRIRTEDDRGRRILDFERCAMLPLRDQELRTGHADDVEAGRAEIDLAGATALAQGWDLAPVRAAVDGPFADELAVGDGWQMEEADPVTAATELARLTLNLAAVHYDRRATGADERLVYGGHAIGLAAHQAAKAIPALCAVIAWHGCDHTAPVREEDLLTSRLTVEDLTPLASGGALAHLRSVVCAERDGWSGEVLDWRFVGVVA
ncbi:MAG: acyl dehydratase [Solirubrobacterales bacterium]|nr:acyl dehydratase [Solirubrobacterales bacterium]